MAFDWKKRTLSARHIWRAGRCETRVRIATDVDTGYYVHSTIDGEPYAGRLFMLNLLKARKRAKAHLRHMYKTT